MLPYCYHCMHSNGCDHTGHMAAAQINTSVGALVSELGQIRFILNQMNAREEQRWQAEQQQRLSVEPTPWWKRLLG